MPAGTRTISANKTDRVGNGKEGTVSAFVINRAGLTGSLKLLNTIRSGGAGPTYVSMHPSGTTSLCLVVVTTSAALWRCCRSFPAADLGAEHGTSWTMSENTGPPEGGQHPAGQLRLQRSRLDSCSHEPGKDPLGALRPQR